MDAKLAKMLLRYVQSEELSFPLNLTIKDFLKEHSTVGLVHRNKVVFTLANKETIRDLLRSQDIQPDTPPDAWDGVTRAEALQLGSNEKFTSSNVKVRRVLVKALTPQMPLYLDGQKIFLPPRCNVEVDYDEMDSFYNHDVILVVENWECFNDIHIAAQHPHLTFPGQNPLVIWRGDQSSSSNIASMLHLLHQLKQPVVVFGDYDPAGLVIARSMPRLTAFVSPPIDVLDQLLRSKKALHDRYASQLAGCFNTLELRDTPCLTPIWDVMRRAQHGLPQEFFISQKASPTE